MQQGKQEQEIDLERFRSDPAYRRQIEAGEAQRIEDDRVRFSLAAEIGARLFQSPSRPRLDAKRFRTAVGVAEQVYRSGVNLKQGPR